MDDTNQQTHLGYNDPQNGVENEMVGLTPKPDKMPQTVEEWKYIADLYEERMVAQMAANSKLRSRVNTLEQKLERKK